MVSFFIKIATINKLNCLAPTVFLVVFDWRTLTPGTDCSFNKGKDT